MTNAPKDATKSLPRAAIYCRISQDRTGEHLGVDRQLEDCAVLVKGQGWTLAQTYIDNDLSASSGKPRPAYREMLKAIKAGDLDAIVAWHPDRLYRKLADLEELIASVERSNVLMRTVRAGEFDLATPTGRMLARILASVSAGEGEIKADRWKRSIRQRREQGRNPGSGTRMFGYTRDGRIVEPEAEIAKRMARDILNGVPMLALARDLEAEGIRTTRDSVWRTGTIRQYLANPRLAGFSTLNDDIVGDGDWQPILDRDTWETLRALLDARTRPYVPRRSMLNGLIYCGACGHRLITGKQRDKRTYRCPKRPGMPGCGGVSGNADPIEELVESYAKARLGQPEVRAAVLRLASTTAPQVLADIGNLETRLAELEAQLDEPGVPVATILRAIDRTRQRLEETQQQLSAVTPIPIPANVGDWPTDMERRRRLIDIAVARIDLNVATKRIKAFDVERVTITPR